MMALMIVSGPIDPRRVTFSLRQRFFVVPSALDKTNQHA
jgi:hypothetical protein